MPLAALSGHVKTHHETAIYFNPGNAAIKERRVLDSAIAVQTRIERSCGAGTDFSYLCGPGALEATVIVTPGQGAIGGLPSNSPPGWATIGAFDPTPSAGFVGGDAVNIVCIPDPADDVEVCWDQAFSVKPPVFYRKQPRKLMNTDHYVHQRSEGTIELTELETGAINGIQSVLGKPVTIIKKVVAGWSLVPQEIHYYANVIFMPSQSSGEGNDSNPLSYTGTFDWHAVFMEGISAFP